MLPGFEYSVMSYKYIWLRREQYVCLGYTDQLIFVTIIATELQTYI